MSEKSASASSIKKTPAFFICPLQHADGGGHDVAVHVIRLNSILPIIAFTTCSKKGTNEICQAMGSNKGKPCKLDSANVVNSVAAGELPRHFMEFVKYLRSTDATSP
jgi:hypothetical protein